MKLYLPLLLSFIIYCSSCGVKGSDARVGLKSKKTSSSSSIAVLELFTSEGCSSCPPAENLLPQLTKDDSGIYALAFHVDYWNNLGWKDQFSKEEFTERQRSYGRQFRLESIYTPQLVINGKYEMVGSNRITAENSIQKELNEKPGVSIKVRDYKQNNDNISFSYTLDGNWQHTLLLTALIQKQAIIKIRGGENKNRTLTHTNVVRVLKTMNPNQTGTLHLTKPHDLNDDNWNIILYMQDKNDFHILGATSLKSEW